MRMWPCLGLLACFSLLAAPPALADPAADAVCRRLLPEAAIVQDLGSGYVLRELTEDGARGAASGKRGQRPTVAG